MNKTVIGGIVGVIAIGAIAIFVINAMTKTNSDAELQTDNAGGSISRPAVQAVPNTFSIMTPEEKAEAEEAARVKAELAAEAAASSSASSTEVDADVEVEAETN